MHILDGSLIKGDGSLAWAALNGSLAQAGHTLCKVKPMILDLAIVAPVLVGTFHSVLQLYPSMSPLCSFSPLLEYL